MRKTGICSKCQHTELLQILAIPETNEYGSYPMSFALRKKGEGWLGEKLEIVGRLTAYMCRSCGYTEMYAYDPAAIVPDGKYILEYGPMSSSEPYR
jgi:predicted nucleic-acid-binding Zn-ribbon protein